jgi:hypothetical protein
MVARPTGFISCGVCAIIPQYSGVYVRDKGRQKVTAFSALWLCCLCVAAIYYAAPPNGRSPDFYGIALWILSSVVLGASAVILMVTLVSPWAIHPTKW